MMQEHEYQHKIYQFKGCIYPGGGGGGGDFDDLYPDVCVEGLKKDPF